MSTANFIKTEQETIKLEGLLCLAMEHGMTSFEFSNYHTEEQSVAEFCCAA